MSESFMDKFKRGTSENIAAANAVAEKAKKGARESKEGWNTFKAAYNSKTSQSSIPVMPTMTKQAMAPMQAGRRRRRRTRRRRKKRGGGCGCEMALKGGRRRRKTRSRRKSRKRKSRKRKSRKRTRRRRRRRRR